MWGGRPYLAKIPVLAICAVLAGAPYQAAFGAKNFRSNYLLSPDGKTTTKFEELRLYSKDDHVFYVEGFGCRFKLVNKGLDTEESTRLDELRSVLTRDGAKGFKLLYAGIALPMQVTDPVQDRNPYHCHYDHLTLVSILEQVKSVIPNQIVLRLLIEQGARPTTAKSTFIFSVVLFQEDWLPNNPPDSGKSGFANQILESISELAADLMTGD